MTQNVRLHTLFWTVVANKTKCVCLCVCVCGVCLVTTKKCAHFDSVSHCTSLLFLFLCFHSCTDCLSNLFERSDTIYHIKHFSWLFSRYITSDTFNRAETTAPSISLFQAKQPNNNNQTPFHFQTLQNKTK